jgi:hypothetical protein
MKVSMPQMAIREVGRASPRAVSGNSLRLHRLAGTLTPITKLIIGAWSLGFGAF